MIAYKFRAYPNKQQVETLQNQFNLCGWLYNCALEERITAYKSIGKRINYISQTYQLTEIKGDFPEFNNVHSRVLQEVLKRLDEGFKHFFRRVQQGQKHGFPRFKGKDKTNSICYSQKGFKVVGNSVRLSKVGLIKIRLHRKIEGVIKTCTVKKSGDRWFVVFVADKNIVVEKKPINNAVGIDLGLETFAVLSDGVKIDNPRFLRKSEERLKHIQSKYSKHKGQTTKRKLSALHRKVANQRMDFLHKQSRMLVNQYGLIAYEDLNIKPMTQSRFAKSVHDAAWGKFIAMIRYKAENAGSYAIAVNPKHTSQICSGCGTIVKKEIHQRQHDCPVCGISIHRDLNASLNILKSGADLVRTSDRSLHF